MTEPVSPEVRAQVDEWIAGINQLDRSRPPDGVTPARWIVFFEDAARFINGWADQAAALGWDEFQLFGCDPVAPAARVDHQGLVWAMAGMDIAMFGPDGAVLVNLHGARQSYLAKDFDPDEVVLPWEIGATTKPP